MNNTNRQKVAVFCGARFPQLAPNELQIFLDEVRSVSAKLASRYDLVYGGGTIGLMGVIADQFLQSGASVVGVIPTYLNTIEIRHTGLTDTHQVLDLHDRKAKMEMLADLFIVFPGGVGTADEFLEVLTLKSLSRHQKGIFVWNWNHFFDGLISFMNDGIRLGFIDETLIQRCVIEADSSVLLDNLL